MTQRDDYLHDRSGEPDPTIEQLEQLLAPFAHRGADLPLDNLPAQRPAPRLRWPWLLAAAAALLGVTFALWPDDSVIDAGDAPREFVAEKSPKVIRLGDLATLTLQPGSEVRFEHWRKDDQALFSLKRGEIEARVAAPPAVQAGFFQVDTGLGRVIDQGCKYVLSLDPDGANVRVTEGAVTFAFPQRTVFVPAGASTNVVAGRGPSTPLFLAGSDALKKAVRFYDDTALKSRSLKEGPEMRLKALEMVRQHCRDVRDSLPLWHLLADDDEAVRDQAEEALLELVGPPGQLTKVAHWEPEIWLAFLRMRAW